MEIICPKCEAINDRPGEFCARCGVRIQNPPKTESPFSKIDGKYSTLIGGMAFYGCLAAFLIYSDKYGKELMIGAYAFVAYIWWRAKKDPEWLGNAPSFMQGIFAFLVMLFLPITIAVAILLFLMVAGGHRGF